MRWPGATGWSCAASAPSRSSVEKRGGDPLPLSALLSGAAALGIGAGGVFTWPGRGKPRANVRHHRREATRYEREANRLRAYAPDSETQNGAYTVPNTGRTALPAPR